MPASRFVLRSIRRIILFAMDGRGGIAVTVGLGAPVLFMFVGGAVDLADVVSTQASLQRAVDSAAMGGAKQLVTDKSSATSDRAKAQADGLAQNLAPRWAVTTAAQMNASAGTMTVNQTGHRASLFGNLIPPWTVSVTATAQQVSSAAPLCVLGIQSAGSQVVSLTGSALVTAASCMVKSDSDISVQGSAALSAGAVQSVAGATGSISPAPVTDAPATADPFADLAITVPSSCSDSNLAAHGQGTLTLNPGVHCGDVAVTGGAKLVLNPGEHYFVNGTMKFSGQATFSGTDVVVIFKAMTAIAFNGKASMSLEGRKSGSYAGFVMITDRSQTGSLAISTDSARLLHGTIYMPQATLDVSGSGNKVADQSPWTVVVVKQLAVSGSANLVINSSYGTSTIPVPSGVGSSGALRLIN